MGESPVKLVRRRIVLNSALINIIAIAVGAAIGANLRYGLSLWAAQRWGASFPYGTLIVNVVGSFLIGLVLTLATTRLSLSDPVRLLIVTGLLGGFTTFSSLSFEAYSLIMSGSWRAAGIYLASSFGLGMASVFLGVGVARLLP
ncbi:MAG: fluoride efflux transporter CrcB [Roseiflexaceae bacterium]|nr:fluoride efflux transporter CrcB [Roseiflexaceae bacterium]